MHSFRTLAAFCALLVIPAAVSAATLRVGSTYAYAPIDFKNKSAQYTGLDYDLARALAGRLGMELSFREQRFDTLIDSLNSSKYDLLMAAMNDNDARSKRVDFVDYFLTGMAVVVPAANPHEVYNLAGLCGLTVDGGRGSTFYAQLQEQSKKCQAI